MKNLLLSLVCLFTLFTILPEAMAAKEDTIKCRLQFNLDSWSVFYKAGKGDGTIFCDNGQTANVIIRAYSGGITFGKSRITNGSGSFSKVKDISALFGSYATSEAHAGASKSVDAQAMTKGKVSLALTGKGKGFDLGFSFGKFKITPFSIKNEPLATTKINQEEIKVEEKVKANVEKEVEAKAETKEESKKFDAPPSAVTEKDAVFQEGPLEEDTDSTVVVQEKDLDQVIDTDPSVLEE